MGAVNVGRRGAKHGCVPKQSQKPCRRLAAGGRPHLEVFRPKSPKSSRGLHPNVWRFMDGVSTQQCTMQKAKCKRKGRVQFGTFDNERGAVFPTAKLSRTDQADPVAGLAQLA